MRSHGTWMQHPEWGDARVVPSSDGQGGVVLEFFILPGSDPRRVQVPTEEVLPPRYERGQRIFFSDNSGALRSGRLTEQGLHEGRHVAQQYPGPVSSGPVLLIRITGGETISLPPEMVDICSDLEVGDPTSVLAAMVNEGTWWFRSRTSLRRALARERAVFRGLSGLASSSIEINEHQIRAARLVLRDPVSRYILADEVGLGKTIEAGIVVRQHVLESTGEFKVLVVVPHHLAHQWKGELSEKFALENELLFGSVEVCSFDAVRHVIEHVWDGQTPEMLVIDEAHHLATLAFGDGEDQTGLYHLLTGLSEQAVRVLLLSATPVLRDTAGFLAMLHLLDSDAYRLGDLEEFSRKVESREMVANLAFLLARPVKPMLRPGVAAKARGVFGDDSIAMDLLKDLTDAWDSEDEDAASTLRRRLSGYIRSSHQVYRRLIRTRRDDKSVVDALPQRTLEVVEVESEYLVKCTEFLDDWRLAGLERILGSDQEDAMVALFAEWVTKSLERPRDLLNAINSRINDLEGGGSRAFPDERHLLAEYRSQLRTLVDSASAPALHFLQNQDRGARWVTFLSDESACGGLSSALGSQATVITESVPDTRILLVPQSGEEGLNLQHLKASLLHADLPLSTVRIEQRIGRMDRFNAANMSVESIVLVTPNTYQGFWVDAVSTSARVFEESVSSLQYLIAEAEGLLKRELFEHGREAFERFSEALADKDGPYSLEKEETRLKKQDALDSVHIQSDTGWFQHIDDYEFDGYLDAVEWLRRWTVDGLRFKPRTPKGLEFDISFDPGMPHRLRLTDKHLSRAQLRRWFGPAVDRNAETLPEFLRGDATIVTAGDRRRALASGAALLRIGHPLVTGVDQMLAADDRGRTFAVLLGGGAEELQTFFRFDLRLEAGVWIGADNPTLVRRTEELLPPDYLTVWLNAEGQVQTDSTADRLQEMLSNAQGQSVIGPAAWDTVLDGVEGDWRTLVKGLRNLALAHAGQVDRWRTAIQIATDRAQGARTDLNSALKARQATGQADAESEMWGRELYFLDQLEESIRSAQPTVEAVGVLFCDAGSIR